MTTTARPVNKPDGKPIAPGAAAVVTRRTLMAALTAAAAVTGLWIAGRTQAHEIDLVGTEAALFASDAITNPWPRATSLAGFRMQALKRSVLRLLLRSYAAIYPTRFGAEPRALHMLSVADVLMSTACPVDTLTFWGTADREGLNPSKFQLLWRQARLIELGQRERQLARLSNAGCQKTRV